MMKKLFAALLTVILCLGGVALAALALESWEVSSAALTAEQAETIALESLGLTRDQVRFDRSELDYERGVQVWEVEFRYENTEYNFEIDANTGEILRQDVDREGPAKKPETTPSQPVETPVTLTAEQAETIALESLGLTRDQVRFDRSELDYERGVQVWEVELRHENTEYDFEIDATTGEILKQKSEQEKPAKQPETPAVPEPPAEPPKEETAELTEEEAVAIALNHAGLTEEQVTRLRVEKDIDRGVTLYEIDFDHGGYEYEYEIRVSDGKILKQELDWDD